MHTHIHVDNDIILCLAFKLLIYFVYAISLSVKPIPYTLVGYVVNEGMA